MKKIQKSAVRFDNLKQDFLDDKKYSGTAEATLNGYRYDITRFLKFLSDEQLAVNEAGFKRYVIHLTDSGMTANSVNHYIRSVKVFLYAFIEQNADKGNVTIEIGVQSESSAKDTVLADPESAADVFAFADDQLNELVNAGALQEVLLNPDDVKSRNLPGSVGAATMNDKLYAYPMTADNGYFLYYDASILSAEDVQSICSRRTFISPRIRRWLPPVQKRWICWSHGCSA